MEEPKWKDPQTAPDEAFNTMAWWLEFGFSVREIDKIVGSKELNRICSLLNSTDKELNRLGITAALYIRDNKEDDIVKTSILFEKVREKTDEIQ